MLLVFNHLPGQLFRLPPVERRDWEVRVMLNNYNSSEQIRECLRHAEDCAQKAAAQTDPQLKQDFLVMERRWLFLARSYGFTERLTNLSNETKRQADRLPKR
jgi:hypothetical protein